MKKPFLFCFAYFFIYSIILYSSCILDSSNYTQFENDFFEVQIPDGWSWQKYGHSNLIINIPDKSIEDASILIHISTSNIIGPPIIEAMGSNLEILYNQDINIDFSKIVSSKINIDNQEGVLIIVGPKIKPQGSNI